MQVPKNIRYNLSSRHVHEATESRREDQKRMREEQAPKLSRKQRKKEAQERVKKAQQLQKILHARNEAWNEEMRKRRLESKKDYDYCSADEDEVQKNYTS